MLVTEYYRNLPHWQHVGAIFFIMFNLKGAIPREVYERLAEEKKLALSGIQKSGNYPEKLYDEHKRHFARVDRILDACQHGPIWLKQPSIAGVLKNKLHQYDTTNYELLAYRVMANHVHIVVDTAVQSDSLNPDETITSANYTQLYIAQWFVNN